MNSRRPLGTRWYGQRLAQLRIGGHNSIDPDRIGLPLEDIVTGAVGLAGDVSEVQPLGALLGILPAVETGAALALELELGILPAVEVDTARAFGGLLGIAPAAETDEALVLTAIGSAVVEVVYPTGVAWLLDVDLGGGSLAYSTQLWELLSRVDGGPRRYLPGLPDLVVSVDAESLSVSLPLDGEPYVRRHGRLRGRPWVLRLWRGEHYVEQAQLVARGVIGRASWGDPAAPSRLDLDLERPEAEASRTMLPPEAQLSEARWPDVDEDAAGEHAPLVIGRPGAPSASGGADSAAYPATPVFVVDDSAGVRTFVVACHHVAAATVAVWDLEDRPVLVNAAASVVNTTDALLGPCATIGIPHATLDPERVKVYVGWSAGGGYRADGVELRGLGSVLLWGALSFGRGAYDVSALASRRDELDRYLVDAVVNNPDTTWDEWVDSVVGAFGLRRVDGPRGTWWDLDRWTPSEAEIRATLSTAPRLGGEQVSRTAPFADDDTDAVVSDVTVYYSRHGTGAWRRYVRFAAETDPDDLRTVQHPALKRSGELGGGEPVVVYAPTSDPTTAWAIARTHVERYGVPAYLAEYLGGVSLGARLRQGDTVEVIDGYRRLGVVRTVTLGERSTSVTVRFPLA